MSHSASPLPAIQLQVQLTRQWDAACKYMDSVPEGEPYSDRFWQSMAKWWATAAQFEAVENSLARAGQDSCINGPSGCGEAAVSCRWCVEPPEPPPPLSGDSEAKEYRW